MKFTKDDAEKWPDQIMDMLDRATRVLVKYGIPLLVAVGLGYAWRMAQGF